MNSCIVLGYQRAGNHLVMRLLELLGMKEFSNHIKSTGDNIHNMPNKDHFCFSGHMPYDENSELLKKYKGIYISRDLKAVALSNALKMSDKNSFDYRLKFYIQKIKKEFPQMHLWNDHPNIYHVPFEMLIGAKGYGFKTPEEAEMAYMSQHDKIQRFEIESICKFLDRTIGQKELNYVVKNLFGKHNQFFRKGQIKDWKNYFREEKFKKMWKEK